MRPSRDLRFLSERYERQFWAATATTNTVLFAWAAALTLILVSGIREFPALLERQQGLIEQERSRREALDRRERAFRALITGPDAEANAARIRLELYEIEKAREEIAQLKADIAVVTNDKATLRVPFGDINIPRYWSLLIWPLLASCLAFYFLYKRLVLSAILGRVIYVEYKLSKRPREVVVGLGEWAPFWLAPLPRAGPASLIAIAEMRTALGWHGREKWRLLATSAVLLFGLLLYLWVMVITWRVTTDAFHPGMRVPFIGAQGMLLISVGIAVAGLLRPQLQIGRLPSVLIDPAVGRRAFVSSLVAAAFAAGAFLAPVRVRMGQRQPRFRRAPSAVRKDLAGQFVLVHSRRRDGDRVHYVNTRGRWGHSKFENVLPRTYERFSDDQTAELIIRAATTDGSLTPRERLLLVHRPEISRVAEKIALTRFRAKNTAGALELVESTIALTAPLGIRLFDLYAAMAVASGKSELLAGLMQRVESRWPDNKSLMRRVARWTDPVWQGKKREFAWKEPTEETGSQLSLVTSLLRRLGFRR